MAKEESPCFKGQLRIIQLMKFSYCKPNGPCFQEYKFKLKKKNLIKPCMLEACEEVVG